MVLISDSEGEIMLEVLNTIIDKHAKLRDVTMPHIGKNHAGSQGGIFSLLQDPRSDPRKTRVLDVIENKDPTAKWCKALFENLGIPTSVITPWNALGAFEDERNGKAIKDNLPLCQALLDAAAPVALIAQGRLAQRMAGCLQFGGKRFCVPHPSQQSRNSNKDAAKEIKAAFQAAFRLVRRPSTRKFRYIFSES